MDLDDAAIRDIFSPTTGVWTIASILFLLTWRLWNGLPAVMAQWIAWRQQAASVKLARTTAAADARAADWLRLRDEISRLEDRLNKEIERSDRQREEQEAENQRCRQELNVVRAKMSEEIAHRIKLQAVLDGMGRVNQAASHAAAEVRLDALRKKGAKDADKPGGD